MLEVNLSSSFSQLSGLWSSWQHSREASAAWTGLYSFSAFGVKAWWSSFLLMLPKYQCNKISVYFTLNSSQ
jgi:hypothetical protein